MEIHRKLANLCEEYNPNWLAMQNVICIVGNSELRPDVGAWFQWPTFAQLSKPIVHSCPPPNLWIEVILLIISCLKKVCNGWILSEFPQLFFDEDPDCSNAIEKITLVQQFCTGIEYVGIAIPGVCEPFLPNPNPGVFTIPAISQDTGPYRDSYVIHWDVNNNPVYYIMDWNLHLVPRCGVTLDFNVILDVISEP